MSVRSDPLAVRLLSFVTEEPQTATQIWRRFTEQPEGRLTMSTRMRRQRRETGALLEDLAEDGMIERVEVERRDAKVPAYLCRDAYDASLPSRLTLERRARGDRPR